MLRRSSQISHPCALALIVCALLLRALIPAGWMPTAGTDGMIRIAMCTGMGATTAWMDRSGKIHQDAPGGSDHGSQPCGFAVLGHGLDAMPGLAIPAARTGNDVGVMTALPAVSVGRGLAAPPPPSTGPPILI